MVRKLSLPVIIIILMIICGPGGADSYRPSEFQIRPSSAQPAPFPGRGPSWGEQRRRPWTDRISTETLLEFLKEHEKELAARLESAREDNPRNFADQVRALKELYGPVIEQMKEDPKAGKMSLEKIRLRLKIQDAVEQVKKSEPDASAETKKKLADYTGQLFDVIVSEEEYDIDQMEEWLNHPEDRRSLNRGEYRFTRNYIEQNRADLADWKKNKDKIVTQRVDKLLQEHRDFPWGN